MTFEILCSTSVNFKKKNCMQKKNDLTFIHADRSHRTRRTFKDNGSPHNFQLSALLSPLMLAVETPFISGETGWWSRFLLCTSAPPLTVPKNPKKTKKKQKPKPPQKKEKAFAQEAEQGTKPKQKQQKPKH